MAWISAGVLVAPTPQAGAATAAAAAGATMASTVISTAAASTTTSYCREGQGCDYLESWQVQAVRLQNRLDVDVPIRLAGLPHSHNAFNAKKDGYHTDPNHVIGVQRQLRTGVRSLAFDVGAYPTGSAYQSSHSIRLCHKTCSDADGFLGEGLRTVRDYLRSEEGKDEVLFLQLELNMPPGNKGKYVDAVRRKIVDELGDFIYRPPGGACTDWHSGVAATVSKADVRAAGKNIVINSAKACYDGKLRTWLFKNTWKDSINLGSDKPGFSGYPSCEYGTKYDAADIQASFFRSFNDGTSLSVIDTDNMAIETSSLTIAQMKELRGCGVNALGPEPLDDWMGRWKAQVWSWGENQPAPPFGRHGRPPTANDDDCALHGGGDRFSDQPCSAAHSFACQHPVTRDWKITGAAKAWARGEATCQAEFGSYGYAFSLPANGYENNRLADAKAAKGVDRVWLHYSDLAREGDWRPGAPVAVSAEPPKATQMLAGGDHWNGGHYTTAIAFGDVDGDGLDELGVTRKGDGGGRWWIFDDAVHDFVELRSGGSGWGSDNYATTIAFGDVDGDGRDEVGLGRKAGSNTRFWILDDKNASFKTLFESGAGWDSANYPTQIAFGDVDGDGRDEVGLTRKAAGNARYFILDDKNASFKILFEGGSGWGSDNYATTIAFGDVDGDGRDEVGVGRYAKSGSRYFVLDARSGSFRTINEGGSGWDSSTYVTSVAFGNVDGDARAEMGVARKTGDNTRFWVLDDEKGSFKVLTSGGSGWGSDAYPTAIAFGDIDADGHDEFGVTRMTPNNSRWFVFEDASGGYKLEAEGGGTWNGKADGWTIAFGKTFDGQADIGVGRDAPDNARYYVLGWN